MVVVAVIAVASFVWGPFAQAQTGKTKTPRTKTTSPGEMKKLDVRNVAGLVLYAFQQGLVKPLATV